MGKINLKATLISGEENLNIETSGIKTNNKIVYKENNISINILQQLGFCVCKKDNKKVYMSKAL